MKRKVIGALALTAILMSCQKEKIVEKPVDNQGKEIVTTPSTRFASGGLTRNLELHQYQDGGWFATCFSPGLNCMDWALAFMDIEVINAVVNTINTGTDDDIKDVFTNNETVLKTVLPDDMVEAVIAGNATVTNLGEFAPGSAAHIMFHDLNGDLIMACPISHN